MRYAINFNTTAAEPVRVRDTAPGTYGRVTAPSRHIGKVVLKLDDTQVLCLNDTRVWTKFGNVFIEPLSMGESIDIAPEFDLGEFFGDTDLAW